MTGSDSNIVATGPDDLPALMALYPMAFPEEDLTKLVRGLINEQAPVLSLAAIEDHAVIGHIVFTLFDGRSEDEQKAGALLGPLAVHPAHQRSGIGTKLVKEGFTRLEEEGVRQVLVLGDPDYYGRFGFRREEQVMPPYIMPKEWHEAWQSFCLGRAKPLAPDKIRLPPVWMRPELWLP